MNQAFSLLVTPSGDLIKQIITTANQIKTPYLGCGLPFHDQVSLFCKICGTPLEQEAEEVT